MLTLTDCGEFTGDHGKSAGDNLDNQKCSFDPTAVDFPEHFFAILDFDHDSKDELVYSFFLGKYGHEATTVFNINNTHKEAPIHINKHTHTKLKIIT